MRWATFLAASLTILALASDRARQRRVDSHPFRALDEPFDAPPLALFPRGRAEPWAAARHPGLSVEALGRHMLAEGARLKYACVSASEVGVPVRVFAVVPRGVVMVNPVAVERANETRVVRGSGEFEDFEVVPEWVRVEYEAPYGARKSETLSRRETACWCAAERAFF